MIDSWIVPLVDGFNEVERLLCAAGHCNPRDARPSGTDAARLPAAYAPAQIM